MVTARLMGLCLWLALGAGLTLGLDVAMGDDGVVVGSSEVDQTRGELDPADTHGWVVIDGETSLLRQSRSWLVLHVPPRHSVHEVGGVRGGPDGSVRQILPALQERPVALAAWGDELFVISEANSMFPQAQRQVGSVRVVPTGIGEYWTTQPTHRLRSRTALSGGGEILGATGSEAGPMVLVSREGSAGSKAGVLLRVLDGEAWREIVLPKDLQKIAGELGHAPTNDASGGRWWRLLGVPAGVEIWSGVPGSGWARVWSLGEAKKAVDAAVRSGLGQASGEASDTAREQAWTNSRSRRRLERERREAEAEREASVARVSAAWTGADIALPREISDSVVPPKVLDFGGRRVLVGWRSVGEGVVSARAGDQWRALWQGAVPSAAGVMGLAGSGRVAFVWPTGPFNSAGYGLQVVEVSVHTGREMFAGSAMSVSPVSSMDLRFLAILLLVASAAVLLFVLKSEASDKAFHLPPETELAEGWRRGMATLIDLFASLAIAAEVQGVDLSDAMSVSGWMTGKGLPVLISALAIACVSCAVLEWLFGRSLGKLVAGCEVVDVSRVMEASDQSEGPPRPTLWRSVLRNAIKWAFPPVGVFMVLDAAGRHPGDVFAKAAVVRWTPPSVEDEM